MQQQKTLCQRCFIVGPAPQTVASIDPALVQFIVQISLNFQIRALTQLFGNGNGATRPGYIY